MSWKLIWPQKALSSEPAPRSPHTRRMRVMYLLREVMYRGLSPLRHQLLEEPHSLCYLEQLNYAVCVCLITELNHNVCCIVFVWAFFQSRHLISLIITPCPAHSSKYCLWLALNSPLSQLCHNQSMNDWSSAYYLQQRLHQSSPINNNRITQRVNVIFFSQVLIFAVKIKFYTF